MKKRPVRRLAALLIAVTMLFTAAMAEDASAPRADLPGSVDEWRDGPGDDVTPEPVDAEVIAEEAVELAWDDGPLPLADVELSDGEDGRASMEASVLAGESEAGIPLDAEHFPDASFRGAVAKFDRGETEDSPGDGCLSEAEIAACTVLTVPAAASDLRGIEYLTGLEYLTCDRTGITGLDVSGLSRLVFLSCDFCGGLKTLTLGALDRLRGVNVRNCENLATLDISRCPVLLESVRDREPRLLTEDWGGETGQVVYYLWGWEDAEESRGVRYGVNVGIVTSESGGASPAAETPATTTPAATETPAAETPGIKTIVVRKNIKVSVPVGTVCRIDTAGKAGRKFKSSKKKVATVDKNGVITAKSAGKTRITFKVGRKTRTLTLKVTDETIPTSIVVLTDGALTGKKGDTVQLTSAVPFGTVSRVKWESSDRRVATVDRYGLVTFKGKGRARITATAVRGGKQDSVKVTVTED